MKRMPLLVSLLLLVAVAAACGSQSALPQLGQRSSRSEGGPALIAPGAPPIPAAAPTAAPMATAAPAQPSGGLDSGTGNLPSALAPTGVDRMVVFNGTLRLEVKDTEQTVSKIVDILKANQGYVANRSLDRDNKGNVAGSIVIRVPAGSLEAVLAQIRALGTRVVHEDSQSEDVTQEYVDLDARRKNKEAYEVELTKLLDTMRERTNKASDLLDIYNQLSQVRGEIEQIKGRQNYLENVSALATYTVFFQPQVEVVESQGWDPAATARQSLHTLVQSLQALADISIAIVLYVVPLALILLLPFAVLLLIARRIWRARSRTPGRAAA